ncbi:hypothetical protein [Longivirga aurantiaca]|uniref:Uncharacterized protein n=1 Tax=Longivirga aurantiaca TaxID=1837743 RepID=A0ABW1SZ50_9ACTN
MATTELRAVSTTTSTAVVAPTRPWVAPAVAASVGALAAVATAWWVAGLELTMRTVGF